VKVSAPASDEIDRIAGRVERARQKRAGVTSRIRRAAHRRTLRRRGHRSRDRVALGLNVADVQSVVVGAIGGDNIGETIEGLQRFPINVRYPREIAIRSRNPQSAVVTERGAHIRSGDVARFASADGPPMLKSENARLSGWVYVDLHGRDLSSAVREMQAPSCAGEQLPAGYSISWSGSSSTSSAHAEAQDRRAGDADDHFVLLYLTFRRFADALLDHGDTAVRSRRRISG
jgi:Cu(I)/Ag(I) efflux system membrane protein CusA/SilA